MKIRRGEDWRSSTHNHVPTHHTVGDFAAMARRHGEIHVFGHDLLNAYMQWPVATFLHTDNGLTLWFHLAMCFGAAALVWNFNRVADALQLLPRMWLLLVGGHYVDDFNGLEYAEHADSAFYAFSDFFHALRLPVKESKAQKPAERHVLQTKDFLANTAGVTLSPTPRREGKLQHHPDGPLR